MRGGGRGRIRIGIQSTPIRIGINSKQKTFSICAVKNNEKYDTFDADEKDKTLNTVNAVTKKYDFPTGVKHVQGSACGSASF